MKSINVVFKNKNVQNGQEIQYVVNQGTGIFGHYRNIRIARRLLHSAMLIYS